MSKDRNGPTESTPMELHQSAQRRREATTLGNEWNREQLWRSCGNWQQNGCNVFSVDEWAGRFL